MDYQEFRAQYEDQHPASVPQPEVYMSEYDAWVIYVVACMFITAAFFSGIHTVPIAYGAIDAKAVADWIRQVGAGSTFVFVEAGVLLSAYLIVKKFSWIMLVILVITISVAMGANLYSVSKAMQDTSGEIFTKAITLLFGLVAPLMAALSGGMFVWLHQSDRNSDARTKIKFRESQIEWDNEIEQGWKKYQKSFMKPVHENPVNPGEVGEVHEPFMKTGEVKKPRVKLHEVAREIHEAGDDNLTTDEMMVKYSISSGSTTKIREILKGINDEAPSNNG